MQHLKFVVNCALVFSSIGAFAQDSARTVQYHSQDIIPIRAKLKYTTLIELPTTEKIMEAATGDKDFWIVDVVGNFCFVHPSARWSKRRATCRTPGTRTSGILSSLTAPLKTVCFAQRHLACACALSCHSKQLPSMGSLFSTVRRGLGRRLWPVAWPTN
jgi:hypothetical protein